MFAAMVGAVAVEEPGLADPHAPAVDDQGTTGGTVSTVRYTHGYCCSSPFHAAGPGVRRSMGIRCRHPVPRICGGDWNMKYNGDPNAQDYVPAGMFRKGDGSVQHVMASSAHFGFTDTRTIYSAVQLRFSLDSKVGRRAADPVEGGREPCRVTSAATRWSPQSAACEAVHRG